MVKRDDYESGDRIPVARHIEGDKLQADPAHSGRAEFPWRITTAAGELMGSGRTEADAKALARMLARVNMGSQFHVKRVGT